MTSTDRAWQSFGENDPYHGVLTKDGFRAPVFDDDARAEFLKSGEDYVDHVLALTAAHVDPDFVPRRVLDFGCGVGRLSLPFARRCQSVVGVDISAAMLTEATANAERAGLTNVKFVSSDDQLSRVEGEFDMIHSFIVLQHIVPRRGEKLIGELIDRLAADGVGILHVTYANASRTPLVRRLMTTAYERVPLANGARNVLKGEHFGKPTMHMHRYDLSRVMRVLQERGCDDVHVRFTEAIHYRYPIYGAILIFRKRVLNPGMYS